MFAKKNYVTVDLPRGGLGHSLESYSRAFVYYASGVAEFIHPNWFKVRIGPYLRGEKDKRNYWYMIKTPKKWGLHPINNWRRFTHRVVIENKFNPNDNGQFLIVKDEGPHSFPHIQPYKQQFMEALVSISRYKINSKLKSPTIGIFHRSGDFLKYWQPKYGSNEYKRRTHGYGYIPPEYAAEALIKCRKIAGWDVPAVLSTDAYDKEIECILSLGNVTLSRSDSALANMLEMRHHDVLIVGTSSYGHWSFFLGDAFGIFPKVKGIGDNFKPLNLPERKGAWFVFDNNTSLNNPYEADKLHKLLSFREKT